MHHLHHLITCGSKHSQVFGSIKVLCASRLNPRSQKTMLHVRHRTRIRCSLHQQLPFAASIPRLFKQLAFRRLKRCLALFHHPTGQLVAHALHTMAVLLLHNKASSLVNSYHIHPIGIFEHIIFGNLAAVGQFYHIAPGSEPGALDEIFRALNLPRFNIFRFHCALFLSNTCLP